MFFFVRMYQNNENLCFPLHLARVANFSRQTIENMQKIIHLSLQQEIKKFDFKNMRKRSWVFLLIFNKKNHCCHIQTFKKQKMAERTNQ